MKFILFLFWLTPTNAEHYTRIYAEPMQCRQAMKSMATMIDRRIDTQLIYAGCSPVAPGMMEGKGA